MMDSRINRLSAATAVMVAAVTPLLASAAVAWVPVLHERFLSTPSVCWSRLLLHRDCAGCGLTRSFVAVSRGDLAAAIQWNPLGPVLYLYLCAMAVAAAGEMVSPRFTWWRRIEILATLATLLWSGVDVLAFYFG